MTDDLDDLLGLESVPPKRGPGRPRKDPSDLVRPRREPKQAKPKAKKAAAPTRRPGRPTKAEAAAFAVKAAQESAIEEGDEAVMGLGQNALPDAAAFHRPVTRTFLATILGAQPRHLVKQLANCPVVGYLPRTSNGERVPLYDFKVALRYVVPPSAEMIEAYMRSRTSTTLPPLVHKAFWEGVGARLRVETQTRDLWRTQDVLDVLGRTALTIKETTQIWLENLPGRASLTSEQHDFLRRQIAGLLDDVHQRLVEMPGQMQTRPVAAEIAALVEEEANMGVEVEGE